MFKKTIPIIGLAAFVALLLAGAANPASAAVLAEKVYLRNGIQNFAAGNPLSAILDPVTSSTALARYGDADNFDPAIAGQGELLVDTDSGSPVVYEALFDIYVFDVTGAVGPVLFRNDLAALNPNDDVASQDVDFGIRNLRFTWYNGAFDTSFDAETGDPSLETIFDPTNVVLFGCGDSRCTLADATTNGLNATWEITDDQGVRKPNSSNFFNYLTAGESFTLTVTGEFLIPDGGGYSSILKATVIPLPPAALLFGTALLGIGALRRWKDKKEMAVAA